MGARGGRGRLALGCLFLFVSLLVLAALAAGMVLSGEVSLYAPRLTGFEPHPGYAFRPTTPITLTFDQPMDPASVQASFGLIPNVGGSFHWNADRTRFTFVPDAPGFEPGYKYRIRLAPGIGAGTLPRTTMQGTEWDISLEPLLAGSTPTQGQTELDARPHLEATFNYLLNCDLTKQTFVITPEVRGTVECHERTLGFSPGEALAPGTKYTAAFAHLFLQDDPSLRPGSEWTFTTAPPLAVVDASPVEQALVENLWTPVRITFNRPVLPDSAKSRFSLSTGDGRVLSGQLTWENGGASFVFKPDLPLEPASRYELALQEGVQDELGFELAAGLSYSFDTPDMVGQPSPAPDSSDVSLDSAIRLPFTRPMDRVSVEAGLLISPALEATPTWEQNTLVLAPRAGLAGGTTYQIGLAPTIRDDTGAPLASGRHWSFATEEFLLSATLPREPVLMELRQPISFTFALPMDRSSVRSALIISPATPGSLAWSDDDRTVSFHPEPGWLAGADYQIALSGAARSAGGQNMEQEQTWSFSTGMTQIQFGDGPNVQVMGADGTRAFQLIAQGADMADFYLYAITPTQFLDLYDPDSPAGAIQAPTAAASSIVTPTAAWREALAQTGDEGYDGWHTAEAHIPADVSPGIYFLTPAPQPQESDGEQSSNQLLVVLTRHVLVLKQALTGSGGQARAQVVAWDTDIRSGTPVISATVRLYDHNGAPLAEGVTGADGLLTLDVPGDPGPVFALSTSPAPTGTVAKEAADVTVCGLSSEWSEDAWAKSWTHPPSRLRYTVYTYTDRPVYHPGLPVYFKAWIRADDDVSYTLPLSLPQSVTIRLRDARDNVAATRVMTPTAFGTTSGEFQLASAAITGTWSLEIEVNGTLSRQPFDVQAYAEPAAEATGEISQMTYGAADSISATVDAPYNSETGGANRDQVLSIQADQASYAPGDQAQLTIVAPVSGPALLTLERGSTHHAERIELVSGTNLITLPIKGGEAPNIYVSVSQFGPLDEIASSWSPDQTRPEAWLATARTELLVPMADRRLTVTLTTDQRTYRPGDEATVHLKVTDHRGSPVVAEVSLGVVDEAIYTLGVDRSADPFDAFYAPRPDLVSATDSLRPTRRFSPQSERGGAETATGTVIHGNFLDTAYWVPAITTGTGGEAAVTFTLPDGLTEWRVLARAVTTDTLVGQATASVVVSQDIAVWPALPSFLMQGDVITLTATVHNFTAEPVSATVEMDVQGLVLPGEPEHDTAGLRIISVPAEGATPVGWPVEADEPGEARVTFKATAARRARVVGRDRVEMPLVVKPMATSEVVTFAGALSPAQPNDTITFTLPSDVELGLSRLEINLASSVAAALQDAREYLASYPDDCVEQTMSHILADAVIASALARLGIGSDLPEANPFVTVEVGLQLLYGFQHDDGGWGWCRYDVSEPEQTAYVLLGLAMTREAGVAIDDGVLARGVSALQAMLPETDPNVQAYAAYALANVGQPVTITLPLTDALHLDLFSRAALAIALDATGDVTSTQALLDSLRQAATEDATGTYWQEAAGTAADVAYRSRVMGSDIRTTAIVVDALARLDPASPLLPDAVRWLMEHRQGQGWGDTQSTSYAILALTDYLLAVPQPDLGTSYQIYVNDRLWQAGQMEPSVVTATLVLTYEISSTSEYVGPDQVSTPAVPVAPSTTLPPSPVLTVTGSITAETGITTSGSLTLPGVITTTTPLATEETITPTAAITASEPLSATETAAKTVPPPEATERPTLLRGGANTIRIVLGTPGEEPRGNLYYDASLLASHLPPGGVFPEHQSHAGSIAVQREYVHQGNSEPATSFRQGDLVQVSLTLDVPDESWYVLVEDPLPAGFEPVERPPDSGGEGLEVQGELPAVGQEASRTTLQFHDGRAVFSIDHLAPGRHTYTYLAQAVFAGSFVAMPSQTSLIYEPDVWSNSGSLRIEIGPR
jgi:uncharacterized protein YfaS (alpha-2-macroglobulin family)